MKNFKTYLLGILVFSSLATLQGQDFNGVYFSTTAEATPNLKQELKIQGNYMVVSVYETSPAKFIKTYGGFFEIQHDSMQVNLEFNSNFPVDSIQKVLLPISISDSQMMFGDQTFTRSSLQAQDLDGPWLFGTRGPDTGQKRRGDSRTRKTLKFLLNGRFQWIAYDTEGMQFKGTGGGSYTSVDGKYVENIEYFSRDNKRVGASLEFNYEQKENDWHHTGKNSKGEPMYEIWQKRK